MLSRAPDNDHRVSTFEDLDPDESPRARRSYRSELLVALLLVLIVGGWGGWDWWRGQAALAGYRLGQAAEAEYEWEAAQRHYLDAGGYADSASRADAAARKAAARDAHYGAARAAAGSDPLAALRELQALRRLQPEYLDSEALYATAEREVYNGALDGSVALRADADPAGLYLRGPGGWTWLAASDAASQVQPLRGCPYLVYDVPAPAAAAGSSPDPAAWRTRLAGRRLHAARLDRGRLEITHFSFDPASFTELYCLKSGLLAARLSSSPPSRDDPSGGLSPLEDFVYQGLADARARPLPAEPGAVFLAASGAHDLLLLARVTAGPGESLATRYSVLDPRDGRGGEISRQPGRPLRAVVSPDGRQALLYDYTPQADTGQRQGAHRVSIKVVDLLVQQWTNVLFAAPLGPELWADTDFWIDYLDRGVHAGKILIVRLRGENRAWMLDGEYPHRVAWTQAAPPGRRFSAGLPFDGGLLVSWSDIYCRPPDPPTVERTLVTYVDSRFYGATLDLGIHPRQFLDGARVAGDRLVYTASDGCWMAGARSHAIASVPLAALAGGQAKPEQLDSTTHNTRDEGQNAWALGPRLLAYLSNGELRVRAYDGGPAVTLERGITALYTPLP